MATILIAEDEEILRETYRAVLASVGHDVRVASDGSQAWQLLQGATFDLVLLDLMMPRVDGVAFLTNLSRSDLPRPHIIILSNLSFGEDLNQAKALGADRSFVKADLSPRQLLALVEEELRSAAGHNSKVSQSSARHKK